MRSKTYMSKINLQSGILTVENRRSRDKKRICSEVSVNSPVVVVVEVQTCRRPHVRIKIKLMLQELSISLYFI